MKPKKLSTLNKKGVFGLSKKQIVRFLAVAAWLALTIFLSQQSGTESAALSGGFTTAVVKVLNFFGLNPSTSIVHYCLRKMAHVGVHLVLAILTYRAMVLVTDSKKIAISVSWLACCAVAAFDELIQLVAVGRASDPRDMTLNLLGVSVGIIVGILITREKPSR